MFLVTEKRERDVLGQIAVPLSSVDDDSRSTEPLRVPLQPGLCCPDLLASPGELLYNVWITTRDATATPEDRSLTSRTTDSLRKLRRKLNSSPIISSTTRWNDFKTSRRHSIDTVLDLQSGRSTDFCRMYFDDESYSSPTTTGDVFMPLPSSDGYVKRSSLPMVSEYYFPHPQILEVWPSEGPSTGGTVVTVRGRDLGLSIDDVVGLYICGSDVLDSVQYISSERLVCTTVAWRPCVGSITVETGSGGRVSSTVQFTFTARSETPPSRLSLTSSQPSSELSFMKNLRRRFSLGALENIESPHLEKDALRRQKSSEAAISSATSSSELRSPVVDIQATRTSSDVTRPGGTLPQTQDHTRLKSNNEKVTPILFR